MRLREHDLVWREIDGDMVLLDLATSKYLTTNQAGTFLLQLLTDDQDRESLVSALSAKYGISTDSAEADTDAFISLLRERDLLV